MGKRVLFEEVQKYCKEKNIILITTKENYVDTTSPLNFICSCGRNSNLSFTKLKVSNGFCAGCRYERSRNKLQLDCNAVKEFFENHGCVLISEYINSQQKLNFICSCGRIGNKIFSDFKRYPICLECSIEKGLAVRKETYENVCEYFKKYDCKIITPKEEYKNKRTKVEAVCSCGNKFIIRVSDFYGGKHICNQCVLDFMIQHNSTSYQEVKFFIEENSCILVTSEKEYKNSKTLIKIQCACGNTFETRFILFKHENKRQCNSCGIATRSGEFAPRWKGGITSESEKIRHSKKYVAWRNKAFERDGYTCQCCGDNRGGNLQVHHLYNFSEHPDLRFDLDNSITLCETCHNFAIYGSFHHVYGANNNTPEQLYEYITRYKSGEFNELKNKTSVL